MTDEADPEVLDDLRLRDESKRDRSPTRGANYGWTPTLVVAQWKCFSPHCSNLVDVPDGIEEYASTWDRQLAALGEPPIDRNKILRCESCKRNLAVARREAYDKRVAKERSLIAELKAEHPPNGDREREILDQLEIWHHPDMPGLIRVLDEKRRGRRGRKQEL